MPGKLPRFPNAPGISLCVTDSVGDAVSLNRGTSSIRAPIRSIRRVLGDSGPVLSFTVRENQDSSALKMGQLGYPANLERDQKAVASHQTARE